MKHSKNFVLLLFATLAAVACAVAATADLPAPASPPTSRPAAADDAAAAIANGKLPPGYRDWRLISVAREEGELDDIRAILGNDLAIKAYRDGAQPYPDGTIVARIAWA